MTVLEDPVTTPPAPDVRTSRGPGVWLALGSVAAVLGVVFFAMWAVSALAHRTTSVSREFAVPIRVVDVSVDAGDATVSASHGPVHLDEQISEGLFGAPHSARVLGDRLVVRGGCPPLFSTHCSVDVTLRVPAGVRVIVHTDNGTNSVSGIDGGARLSSGNGNISAVDVGGDVSISTDNGDVSARAVSGGRVSVDSNNGDVSLGFSRPPSSLTTHSDNGDVTVVLPTGGAAYALHTTTDNGSVSTPIRTDPSSGRHIRATSNNGNITIRYAD